MYIFFFPFLSLFLFDTWQENVYGWILRRSKALQIFARLSFLSLVLRSLRFRRTHVDRSDLLWLVLIRYRLSTWNSVIKCNVWNRILCVLHLVQCYVLLRTRMVFLAQLYGTFRSMDLHHFILVALYMFVGYGFLGTS